MTKARFVCEFCAKALKNSNRFHTIFFPFLVKGYFLLLPFFSILHKYLNIILSILCIIYTDNTSVHIIILYMYNTYERFLFSSLFRLIDTIDKSYRSDGCTIDDAHHIDNNIAYPVSSQHNSSDSPNTITNRSPLQLRQASPFPMESTNSRRIHYVNPQDRLRANGNFSNLAQFSP